MNPSKNIHNLNKKRNSLYALPRDQNVFRMRHEGRTLGSTECPQTRNDSADGILFTRETPAEVREILAAYRQSGKQIRLFYGDANTGRDWLQETCNIGYVSVGGPNAPVPMLSLQKDGTAEMIQDEAIIRIMDVETRKELYAHKTYYMPRLEIRTCHVGRPNTHGVWCGGVKLGGFTSFAKAAHWVAFMAGESMEMPVIGHR